MSGFPEKMRVDWGRKEVGEDTVRSLVLSIGVAVHGYGFCPFDCLLIGFRYPLLPR